MIPKKNDFVKIYFTNGFVADGFVESWEDLSAVLKSQDESTITVISLSQILFYKILIDKKTKVVSDVYVDKELVPKTYKRDPVDRALGLAELYKLQKQEELERARKKLTEFNISSTMDVTYDNYSILRDESILHNTAKED